MLVNVLWQYNLFTTRFLQVNRVVLAQITLRLSFLSNYYRLSDLAWQDGLLIDFLQKKVADKWIRRFLVHSSYLFSERELFKFVVRFYIDYVVWPMTLVTVFEFSNVSALLNGILVVFLTVFFLFHFNYLFLIMF